MSRWLRDDRGSLPFALLLTLVGTALSALLLPMVLTQLSSTRVQVQRVRALAAAQAGLDVGLGQIRAADDGTTTGQASKLPCGLSGSVGGDLVSRYQVTITYYDYTGGLVSCAAARSGTLVDHAVLDATGTAVASRELSATYKFWVTDQNIPGGAIPVCNPPPAGADICFGPSTGPVLCMDAGSTAPAVTTALRMQPCVAGAKSQSFAYTQDLTVMLVPSASTPGGPMCLDAAEPHTLGEEVEFQKCGPAGSPLPSQVWSLNNHANLQGSPDGKALDDYCFNVEQPGFATSRVVLGSGSTSTCQQRHDNREAFQPDPSVGAGAAGPPKTNQLVNYQQFGRCLDVPGSSSKVNTSFLIVWPCKQAPDPTTIAANEKWTPAASPLSPGSGKVLLTMTDSKKGRYCLRTPDPGAVYVVLEDCNPGKPIGPEVEWTMTGGTGSISDRYLIRDEHSLCLSPDDASNSGGPQGPGVGISRVIVVPCGPSTLLKWNAQTSSLTPLPVTNLTEK